MKKIVTLIWIIALPCLMNAQEGMTLDQCRKLALEHNQKIKMAKNQVKAADAVKKAAFTQYFPDFSANGAYTYINKDYQLLKSDLFLPVVPYSAIDPATGQLSQAALSTPSVAASTFVINPATGTVVTDASGNPVFQKYTYLPAAKSQLSLDNVYIFNGGFTQPIFMGGKIRQANKIASYTREIAEHNLSLNEDELIYSVDEAYWRIISLKEKVKLAEQYKSMLTRLVNDLSNIHSEGIITNNDLLKAKLKLSESELLLLQARNGMEISKMVLCQMTGTVYTSEVNFSDSLNTIDPVLTDYPVTAESVAARPELKILDRNVDIAKSGVKIMMSRYLPNIVMNAGYTFMNPNPYNGLAKEFGSDYNIGVAVNIPIFHFGDKKHTLDAAKLEQETASLKLEESKELILLQLQQAVYKCTESIKKNEYASQAFDQASENLKYTEDNFHEGRMKTSGLLEAQVLWQKAWSELIDARTEKQLSVSNLKKVTGKY